MFPVIASIAGFTVSSFGLFLLLAFLAAFFVIWRIIRLYEVDPEKVIDLSLITFTGSLIGARLYYLLTHFSLLNAVEKAVNIYRYPGLSFWGGLAGGVLTLLIVSRRLKLRFWQAADLVVLALMIGLFVGNIGCLLGSCSYGNVSNLPFAVTQAGVIGKRLPVQIIEALFSLIIFYSLWKSVIKFHIDGQIAGLGLILLAVLKLILEPFRPSQLSIFGFNLAYVYEVSLLIVGIWVLYKKSQKSVAKDLSYSVSLLSHQNRRKQALSGVRKWWYNLYVNAGLSLSRLKRNLFKLLHVKANPDQF